MALARSEELCVTRISQSSPGQRMPVRSRAVAGSWVHPASVVGPLPCAMHCAPKRSHLSSCPQVLYWGDLSPRGHVWGHVWLSQLCVRAADGSHNSCLAHGVSCAKVVKTTQVAVYSQTSIHSPWTGGTPYSSGHSFSCQGSWGPGDRPPRACTPPFF